MYKNLRKLMLLTREPLITAKRGQVYKVGDKLKVGMILYQCNEETTEHPPFSNKWTPTHKLVRNE